MSMHHYYLNTVVVRIHQAIIDGEAQTGITIVYMVKKLDAGNIISQKAINIEDNDDVGFDA